MTGKLRWQRGDGEGSQERGIWKRPENQLKRMVNANFTVGEKRLLTGFDISKNKGQPRARRKTDSKTLT